LMVSSIWLVVVTIGLLKLAVEWIELDRLRRNATPLANSFLHDQLSCLCQRMGLSQSIVLLSSTRINSPMTAGVLRPFIVFPEDSSSGALKLTAVECESILAHELAHVAHRDAWWNLVLQFICRMHFFQPLNRLAADEIRQQMDFVADASAAFVLGERTSLARCLFRYAERLSDATLRRSAGGLLASGMAIFESALGRRIERLLDERQCVKPVSKSRRLILMTCVSLGAIVVALVVPRAVAETTQQHSSLPSRTTERDEEMNRQLASMMLLTALTLPAAADDATDGKQPAAQAEVVPLKTTTDELPAGVRGLNGMLVGKVAAKDAEQGTFTVRVDAVSRVWENSRAEDPRSIVGKTVKINGVFGKFLDVLIVTRVGETVEFECKYDDGQLVFPGELLRKVAPFDVKDYPVLPEEFRGFKGLVVAEVTKKDPETFEVILRVDQVRESWEGNRAKNAKSIEGKALMLVGFWNRREAFHALKEGARIEVGMQHATLRSDHLTVIEGVRTVGERLDRPKDGEMRREERSKADRSAAPQRGFRGMLVGRLVEKDTERGTFSITVDAVPRVWENNEFEHPKSLIGKQVAMEGVGGRLIDAMVVARIGDTLEFGALYEGGNKLHVGEVLHKVAPVKPGDYPVLPDEFRGFRGMTTAKVVRKSDELFELIVEVTQIHETFEENRAENPRSIIGKQLMLGGFWNRKDEYHSLKVGDTIRCGMTHNQLLSDHLNVVESLQKSDQE